MHFLVNYKKLGRMKGKIARLVSICGSVQLLLWLKTQGLPNIDIVIVWLWLSAVYGLALAELSS